MGDFAYLLFLIGLGSFVVAIVFFARHKPKRLIGLAGLIGVLFIAIASPTISKDVDEQEKIDQAAAEEKKRVEAEEKKAKEEAEKNAPIDEKITKVIYDTLGKKTNNKKDRIHKIVVSGNVANVWLNADENLTNNMTKKGMWIDSLKGLEELAKFEDLEIISFVWMYTFVDKYGEDSEGKIMSLDFPRDVIDKINFDKVDYNNAPDIAENYWEHNALSE
ncbi:hypothetical protein ACA30_15860 [Virgibacillus soli]|nr:hypothetical protein ACA30_15860 [Virgibacillus soli]